MQDDYVGDEHEIDEAVAELLATAQETHTAGQDLHREVVESDWAGPMRDRFVVQSEEHHRELTSEAQSLLDAANSLRQHAQWIRDEKSRLDALANRIISWASANPSGSSKLGHDASMIGAFPAPHTFGWDDLAERLRASGVAF